MMPKYGRGPDLFSGPPPTYTTLPWMSALRFQMRSQFWCLFVNLWIKAEISPKRHKSWSQCSRNEEQWATFRGKEGKALVLSVNTFIWAKLSTLSAHLKILLKHFQLDPFLYRVVFLTLPALKILSASNARTMAHCLIFGSTRLFTLGPFSCATGLNACIWQNERWRHTSEESVKIKWTIKLLFL